MISIKMVELPDEKTAITKKIMHSLPAWFSPPEDIEKKAVTHRDYPFFAAYDDDRPIGFVALKIHNQYAADIFNLGVLELYHRRGIGKWLVDYAEQYCHDCGYMYLTVKTLDSSAEYEPYERTRAFYKKMGFIPLEVFTTFWDADNPCLFLAKWLGGGTDISVRKTGTETVRRGANREVPFKMNIIYTNEISVDDYNTLRISAGWSEVSPEQAQAGLDGSSFLIAAKDGTITLGMARLLWDRGNSALIKDVLVLPEYQGKGIGTAMMERILSYLKEQMEPGWGVAVDLMSAIGKETFCEKFGFVTRPRERRVTGMDMWIIKEL